MVETTTSCQRGDVDTPDEAWDEWGFEVEPGGDIFEPEHKVDKAVAQNALHAAEAPKRRDVEGLILRVRGWLHIGLLKLLNIFR